MKYYTEEQVRRVVAGILDGTIKPSPHDPGLSPVDRIVQLISTISNTCYGMGMTEVQLSIKKALRID